MPTAPKKSDPTPATREPTAPTIEAEAPKVAPAYNPDDLADVLKRLRSLITEIKELSGDLAAHHRKYSRVHHVNGYGEPLEAPAAHDPALMARLHMLQSAIGEFIHVVGAHA